MSAILDFDRLRYDYPDLDVARAILSCCYVNDHFESSLALSFVKGYQQEHPLQSDTLSRSMQLLYWLESEWWIHAEPPKPNTPPVRFKQEMCWLANNIDHFDVLFK